MTTVPEVVGPLILNVDRIKTSERLIGSPAMAGTPKKMVRIRNKTLVMAGR
jgi:hypothetical protein